MSAVRARARAPADDCGVTAEQASKRIKSTCRLQSTDHGVFNWSEITLKKKNTSHKQDFLFFMRCLYLSLLFLPACTHTHTHTIKRLSIIDVFSTRYTSTFLDSVTKPSLLEKGLHNISLAIITHLLAESYRYHNLSMQVKQSY